MEEGGLRTARAAPLHNQSAGACIVRGLASIRPHVRIPASFGDLRRDGADVLTRGCRGLECMWERRCAWCATFPTGEYIVMYETGHAYRKTRLSA